jgi:hypothetical protein
VYPEYKWLPWLFERLPPGFWRDANNLRLFLNWAGKKLGIKEMKDWVAYPFLKEVQKDYSQNPKIVGTC